MARKKKVDEAVNEVTSVVSDDKVAPKMVDEVQEEEAEMEPTASEKKASGKVGSRGRKKAVKERKFVFQYAGRDYTQENIMERVLEKCRSFMGLEEKDIRTLEMYAKPEEGKCYFVANGMQGDVEI